MSVMDEGVGITGCCVVVEDVKLGWKYLLK